MKERAQVRRFCRQVVAAMVLFWSLLTGWNLVVDPYGVFGLYKVPGFNHIKTSNARLTLALQLLNAAPQTLLLGSSRIGSFRHEVRRLGPKALLYSLPDLRASEVPLLADFFSQDAQLSRFYWGIDFFAFNAFASHDTPAYGRLDELFWADFLLRNVLSWETAREGLRVISRSSRPEATGGGGLSDDVTTKRFRATLKAYLGPRFYWGYRFDESALVALETKLSHLKNNGAAVTLFIGPLHGSLALALLATGNWQNFEAFKRAMTNMAARLEVPLWDFATFNSISTEPIGPPMQWFHDPSHYEQAAAALMTDRILAEVPAPDDFGQLLLPSMLEPYLAQQRQARDLYLQAHPEIAQLIGAAAADAGVVLIDDLGR